MCSFASFEHLFSIFHFIKKYLLCVVLTSTDVKLNLLLKGC